MATVYRNPRLDPPTDNRRPGEARHGAGKEPDTRVPPPPSRLMAAISVNGVAIDEQAILAEAQHHPADDPGKALHAAARALVVRRLLLDEACRLGIAARPQTDGQGRSETQTDAAIRALMDHQVQTPLASEAECRRYYDRHASRFTSQPLFEASHILLAVAETDRPGREEARRKAQALCDELTLKPERFAALAETHSDCPSAVGGGSLGQLTTGSIVAPFEAALGSMQEGEITAAPVESRFGFHVIRLERRIEGRQLPFEMVHERIAAWLEASAWSKAVAQYIAILAGRASIQGISLDTADGPLVQ